MTIQIKDIVINTERFIFAGFGNSSTIRIWMEGMPSPTHYITIRVKNYEEGLEVLAEINEKCNKKK